MSMLGYLLRHSPKLVGLAVAAGVVSGASSTGLLALINAALAGGTAARGALLAAFVALCAVVPVSRVASEFLLIRLGQETVLRLRLELSRRVLAVPLRRLEEIGPHRVLSTLAEDVPSITGAAALLPLVCINAAVLAGCLAYLGWLSPPMLLGVVGVIALGVLSYQLPVLRANRYFRRARALNDELYRHFRGLTEGAKELKLHARRRQAFLDDDLRATAERFRDQTIAGGRIYTAAASWGQLLVFVVIGLVLFLPGEPAGGGPVLTGYALTLLYLMTPLQMLMNSVPAFHRARVAFDRVDRLGLDLAADAAEPVLAEVAAPAAWRRLELSRVVHAYGPGGFSVGPVDLALAPGELLFVAGGNGSGKTTLAKLITGLYVPDAGEVRLDGRPIADDGDRERYRQLFSVVFFDFHLFERLAGLEDDDLDGRAARHLRTLQLEHKVEVREGRLTSTDLSQGQRKRLALLTAYLEDRPIYLFDEWAADQDPAFKEHFYRVLLPELKARGKACVVITHDDRYYDVADRVIKIEEGRIVEGPAAGGDGRLRPLAAAGGPTSERAWS